MRVDRRRRDPRAALLGPARDTPTPLTGVPRGRDRRAHPRRAAHVGPAAQGLATCRSASSSPAASTRARTPRCSPRARRAPVKTFSIGYEGEYESYQNELHYARQMAERVGAEHHERLLTVDDLLDFLPKMVQLQDEPIADPVCVPVYYVSKLARDNGVIVVPGRRGRRRALLGLPDLEDYRNLQRYDDLPVPSASQARRRRRRRRGWARASGARYEVLRRGARRPADLLGRRRGVHAHAEAAAALAAPARASSTGLSSWDAIEPIRQRFEEKAWERVAAGLDDLHGPEHAAARAAADARRQDEHGRQPRGAGAVPRPQVRRARALASPRT